MKKMMKLVSAFFVLALLMGLTACGKNADEPSTPVTHASSAELVGVWVGTGNELSTINMGADGSYKDAVDDISIIGTYAVDEIAGTITVYENEYGMVFTYDYELSGDNLTLQMNGGLPRTFTKK